MRIEGKLIEQPGGQFNVELPANRRREFGGRSRVSVKEYIAYEQGRKINLNLYAKMGQPSRNHVGSVVAKNNNKHIVNALRAPKPRMSDSPAYNAPVDLCMPQNIMFRNFKPESGKGYFNYTISRNTKKKFSDITKAPGKAKIERGIVLVGKGEEGVTYVGCTDDKCKHRVIIKAEIGMNKMIGQSGAERSYDIHRHVMKNCMKFTPHFVTPYAQKACRKAFQHIMHPDMTKAYNRAISEAGGTLAPEDARIIVSYFEFFNGGDLFTWLRRHSNSLTPKAMKVIVFQVLWTIKVILEKVPSFRHNDLHIQNVLVRTDVPSTGTTKYDDDFEVPNVGIFTGIGDFGWSSMYGAPNPRLGMKEYAKYHVYPNAPREYDHHLFLSSLMKFLMSTNAGKFVDLEQMINEVIPYKMWEADRIRKSIAAKHKTKPINVVLAHPYFAEFRKGYVVPKPVKVARPVFNGCGDRARKDAPTPAGRMSTAKLVDLILTPGMGTDIARQRLAQMGGKSKVKRSDLCEILKLFSAGRRALGMKPGTNANKAARNAAKAVGQNNNKRENKPIFNKRVPAINYLKFSARQVNRTARVPRDPKNRRTLIPKVKINDAGVARYRGKRVSDLTLPQIKRLLGLQGKPYPTNINRAQAENLLKR